MGDAQLLADFLIRFSTALFSWPVAIILIAYWFRQPIIKFLSGLRRLTAPGFGLEADVSPPQQNQTTIGAEVSLADPKTEQGTQAPPIVDKSPWHKHIREQFAVGPLLAPDRPPEQRATAAFAMLVTTVVDLLHERSYRSIFGSQISALQTANLPSGLTSDSARKIFDAAAWPEGIEKRDFVRWRDWMVKEELVEDRDGTLYATARGVDFLRYIVEMKLSPKAW
jgi:hypothetical protein